MLKNKIIRAVILILTSVWALDFFGILSHILEINYDTSFSTLQNVHIKEEVLTLDQYSFLLNPSKKCEEGTARITILVKSALSHKKRRESIRRTWGNEKRFSDVLLRTYFVVGTSLNINLMDEIQSEFYTSSDIIQADFVDSYYNNTLKTILGMRWLLESCPMSDYFMFVDDDYLVSIKNVLRYLKSLERKVKVELKKKVNDYIFSGYVIQSSPQRHKFSKWYVSLKEYPFDKWPPYITAGVFILSKSALWKLYTTSLQIPRFRFDDIYLGILAYDANITLYHCDKFYFQRPNYDPQSYSNLLASHGFDNYKYMEAVWNECRAAGNA